MKEGGMNKNILRWGILSTARINRAIINALSFSKVDQCYAVASRDADKAKRYAAEWKIPKWVGSYDELLNDPDIDIIYNPLPNHLHVSESIRAMRAGKHVLCEKPLALTPEDVDLLSRASQETSKFVMEAFMYRHHPQTKHVVDLIRGGAVGDVQLIRGAFTFQIKDEQDIRLLPDSGGGSIWDVGCYPISYARTILGEAPSEVLGSAVFNPSGVDESFYGQLLFPSGAIAQFDSGFRSEPRAKMEIVGTKGELTIPDPFKPGNKYTLLLTKNGIKQEIKGKGNELYLGQIDNLHKAILEGIEPLVTLQDSKVNTQVIVSLLRSARSKQWEKVM